MSSRQDLPIKPGEVLLAKYRVERILGAGGMGAVAEVTHLALDQRMAMKIMLPNVADRDGNLERFMREARAASKLRSEHVPKVLDFGTLEQDMPYLVMELLEGEDLAAMIRPDAPLAFSLICEICIQACEALSEAHGRGIIHRDIKPANIFVTHRTDGSPCVKVLDFGIAKQLSPLGDLDPQGLTATDALIGSPYYMSPEQLRSAKDVDPRSDVWAMGVTLYQALTGKRPFVAQNVGALILCIVESVPPAPHILRPEIPAMLGDAVMRCLQRKPSDRFQNMFELAMALAPFAPPRCHALYDRIAANCDPQGDRSNPSGIALGYAAHTSPTPTPSPRAMIERPSFEPNSGIPMLSKTNEPWAGTHSFRRYSGAGRWAAIGGAALIGAIITAVVLQRGPSGTSEPSPASAAPSASAVAVQPILAPTPTPMLTTMPLASASSAAEPTAAPTARATAPTTRKTTTKSSDTTKLPDYGGRK